MKEKVMLVKVKNNIFRLVLGTNEADIFYIVKGFKGVWKIAHGGSVIDFAPTKGAAVKLATQLHQGA
jgi:uncharacterized membrane protein YuzA (DUF378 family)